MVGLLFIFQNLVCLFITGYVIVKIIYDIYDITINGIKCNIKTVTIFFQVDEYKYENIKNMKNMINIHNGTKQGYITHEAAYESTHDLDFRNQRFTTYCNVYHSTLLFTLDTPPPLYKIDISHIFIFNIYLANSNIIFIHKSSFMIKLSNLIHFITWSLHGSENPIVLFVLYFSVVSMNEI